MSPESKKDKRREALLTSCRALPHVTEDVKWGNDLVFSIGAKMFAVFDATEGVQFGFKTSPEEFDFLLSRPGIIPAPYAARYHWVRVESSDAMPLDNAKKYLEASYRLVGSGLTKKLQRELGLLSS